MVYTPYWGPPGVGTGWEDGPGGHTPELGAALDNAEAGIVAAAAGLDEIAPGAPGSRVAMDRASATDHYYYVSRSAAASDTNSGLSPGQAKATIAGALTALGANPGVINLGAGTFTISATDGVGNCATLSTAGQQLLAASPQVTTVVVNVNCTWGIKLAAQFCRAEGMLISIPTGKTVTYGVGVSPPLSPGSTEYCRLSDLYVSCVGTVTAGIALGPDLAGSSALDVANTTLTHCDVTGAGAATAYLVGNGTSGNVLRNTMLNCGASGTVNGITLAGSGVTWTGGGFSGLTGTDINITQPGGDAYSFNGLRCEGGVKFLDSGYIGGANGAITLNGCNVGAYTPADGVTLIQHNATLPLVILGGIYTVTGGATAFKVNTANGTPLRSFTAIGVLTDNATPYPTNTTGVTRTILGALMYSAGSPASNPAFQFVVDGQQGVVNTVTESARTAATALTAADLNRMQACTLATAGYTVTLPTPVGVTGQQIGVRVVGSSTKLLTLATAAGLIDGLATRIMWAGESAILESDGTNWLKIGGKTIPMDCELWQALVQSVAASTTTTMLLDTSVRDNTGLMATLASNLITINRPGRYTVKARIGMASAPGVAARNIIIAQKNSLTTVVQNEINAVAGTFLTFPAADDVTFAAADTVRLQFFQSGAAAWNSAAAAGGSPSTPGLTVCEIPAW